MGSLSAIAPLLMGVILMIVAGRQFSRVWRDWREIQTLRAWPTVTGTITHSWAKYTAPYDDPNYSHAYVPEVRFQYTVEGRTYATAEFVHHSPDREEIVRAIVDRYPLDAAVVVYYDPANPRTAVLEPGAAGRLTGPGLLGGLELLVGVVLFVVAAAQMM